MSAIQYKKQSIWNTYYMIYPDESMITVMLPSPIKACISNFGISNLIEGEIVDIEKSLFDQKYNKALELLKFL